MEIKNQTGDLSGAYFDNDSLQNLRQCEEVKLEKKNYDHELFGRENVKSVRKSNLCHKVVFRTNLLKVKERKTKFRVMSWLYSKAGTVKLKNNITFYKVIPAPESDFDLDLD